MEEQRENTGCDRGPRGRFAAGNRIGKGSAVPRKAAKFREALFSAVSVKDFRAVAKTLIKEALDGRGWAVKLLFAYLLGAPVALDVAEQLSEIEKRLNEREQL
jgi:hypothetical protein